MGFMGLNNYMVKSANLHNLPGREAYLNQRAIEQDGNPKFDYCLTLVKEEQPCNLPIWVARKTG